MNNGDSGFTDVKGKRVSKDADEIMILGAIDETIAALVFAQSLTKNDSLKDLVPPLSTIAAIIAGYEHSFPEIYYLNLEKYLSSYDFPHTFSYPFDQPENASINLARTSVRKLERILVSYHKKIHFPENILCYVNRLSTYLYFLQISLISHSNQE